MPNSVHFEDERQARVGIQSSARVAGACRELAGGEKHLEPALRQSQTRTESTDESHCVLDHRSEQSPNRSMLQYTPLRIFHGGVVILGIYRKRGRLSSWERNMPLLRRVASPLWLRYIEIVSENRPATSSHIFHRRVRVKHTAAQGVQRRKSRPPETIEYVVVKWSCEHEETHAGSRTVGNNPWKRDVRGNRGKSFEREYNST